MRSKERFLPVFLFAAAVTLGAQTWDLPFSAKEFNIDLYKYPYMVLTKNYLTDDINTVYTFVDRNDNFELRYALFAQTETNAENIHRSFALFVIPVINNAAGFEVDLNEVELYDEDDVFEEYNGDIGISVFIPSPPSDYGGGHTFMLLSFFCKIDQGIVMQTILFDDLDFAGTEEFDVISHSFSFYD